MSVTFLNSPHRSNRQTSVFALLAVTALTALLWAFSALPAEAKKGGVPAWKAETAASTAGEGHGANQPGPYDPSGVGLPSGNGNNDHNNGKRPCAGCVGNADDKNPPGQVPWPDQNKGYECDGNQGVGKTNPAHSGCGAAPAEQPPAEQPPGEQPPVTPIPAVTPPPPAVTPPSIPPTRAPAAGGQPPSEEAPSEEAPSEEQRVAGVQEVGQQPGEQPEVARAARPVAAVRRVTVRAQAAPAAELPFTGSEPLALALLGFLSLATGLGIARALRPGRHA